MPIKSYKTDNRGGFREEILTAIDEADKSASDKSIDVNNEDCFYAISLLKNEWIAVLYVKGSTFVGTNRILQNGIKD